MKCGSPRGSGASLRWQCHPLDRIRIVGGDMVATVDLLIYAPVPHLLLYGTLQRGATNQESVGRP